MWIASWAKNFVLDWRCWQAKQIVNVLWMPDVMQLFKWNPVFCGFSSRHQINAKCLLVLLFAKQLPFMRIWRALLQHLFMQQILFDVSWLPTSRPWCKFRHKLNVFKSCACWYRMPSITCTCISAGCYYNYCRITFANDLNLVHLIYDLMPCYIIICWYCTTLSIILHCHRQFLLMALQTMQANTSHF